MNTLNRDLVHPGKILLKAFLSPSQVTPFVLSREIGVKYTHILEIIKEQRSISHDLAMKLGEYFAMEHHIWIDLQIDYDVAFKKHCLIH